uniref:ADP-ribosylarginine hydrolase n=1 Tax=Eptatretus burgeri TaxID=7764 RepID=A0A8C4N4N2_EPTBU
MASVRDRYRASLLLAAAGDALGYRNARWEYCESAAVIHSELTQLGGLAALRLTLPDWPVSDDTVLHLATGEGLTRHGNGESKEELFQLLAANYVEAMTDMEGRKPGPTSILGTSQLRLGQPHGYHIPFNPEGTGCGAAMRSMCIGLRYPKKEQLEELVAVSVESGRMTHHHPIGYLGGVVAALFTSLAVRGEEVATWGQFIPTVLTAAWKYVKSTGFCVSENLAVWSEFGERWERYLSSRNLLPSSSAPSPRFPSDYGATARDEAYRALSLKGWAGRSGHDAAMIAYDGLLVAEMQGKRPGENETDAQLGNKWETLCLHAMLHGGDSDSTGTIAGAWWGALHGLSGVPPKNYDHLEYIERLERTAEGLLTLAWPGE